MTLSADLMALFALLPAMTGPVSSAAAAGENAIVLALCSGGSLVVPAGGSHGPGPATQPCCAKGCQRDDRRRRRGQPLA
ncbi:MAG: hypothetical protein KDE15_06355 [Erythrobacter sp.]|nr:hypothetical protein [Erythrobacter sp.]